MKGLIPILSIALLACTIVPASAQGGGIVPSYELSSLVVDYPASPSNSVALQGIAGQSFVVTNSPQPDSASLALGFWDTGVPYAYRLLAHLEGFVGDPTSITLQIRFWNIFGQVTDVVVASPNALGEVVALSWANPAFISNVSVKGNRWLRRASPLSSMTNPFLDYPSASVSLLPGDVVDDNQTDRFDYNAFKFAFGSRPGDAHWNPLADLDGDGEVGRFDYALFKLYFGRIGDN